MKVAYIVGGLPFGGIERWLYDLSLEYGRCGLVRAKVFNLSGTGALLPEYRAAGIDVECIGNGKPAIASHRLDTAVKLRSRLRAFAPDLIHTVHFSANHLGRIASIGLGVPLVTHLRNTKHEPSWHRRFSDKLLSYATTAYIAVSKAVAEVVQSDHNLAKRPVHVLYNALEPSRFNLEPLDLKAEFGVDAPVVLCVGRYVPQKNMDKLVRAIRMLHDQGLAASLILVGEGPERPCLEALRDELDLKKHVILAGFRPDVPAFCKAADIFAMPSEFEGFLIAQLEAMYCGLPCVISEHVPLKEIAGEASLICATDAADIADKLALLLRDDALRAKMGAAAKRIAQPYTMQNYAIQLHALYGQIINNT